jgi:hypothetical protein
MSGTLAPMTMNADEALINAVYCQVQCLGCTDWRSDRISRDRKILFGKAWHARSCRPRRSIMRKCCKNAAVRPQSRT